jgi:ESCRT-II complex subunit VPS22
MHRLGGVGLAAFDRQSHSLQSFAALSSSLNETQVKHLQTQLELFRNALLRFSADHRADIRQDPAFRTAFQQMCASIGVDPLAGPRKGGWWAEMLGLGDWQYELGVQIVDVCVNTRERNGGLIEMGELIRLISKLRGVDKGQGGAITEDDIARSIKTLRPLGTGYEIVEIGNRKMVRSVVKELDSDQAVVLAFAQRTGGRVDELSLMNETKWPWERAQVALENMLMRDGLCWLDEQDDASARVYWVPSALTWE